jgi:hypothetical protein
MDIEFAGLEGQQEAEEGEVVGGAVLVFLAGFMDIDKAASSMAQHPLLGNPRQVVPFPPFVLDLPTFCARSTQSQCSSSAGSFSAIPGGYPNPYPILIPN